MSRKNYTPPVKEGDVLELEVEGHGQNGDPMFKVEGYVIFLKGTSAMNLGERAKIKINKVTPKFGFAEVAD